MAGIVCTLLLLSLYVSPFLLVIGAGLLRAACWMVGVSKPPFSNALAATAFVYFITFPIGAFVVFIGASLNFTSQLKPVIGSWADFFPVLVALLIHLFFSASIYSERLGGITFGQGVLVWLAQWIVLAMIGGGVYAVVFLTRFALGEQSLFEMIGLG